MPPMVISASARTDIPAFYGEWFMNRVRAGFVDVKSPFSAKVSRVSLLPQDVHAIVFWSKNYAPFLQYLPELDARGLDAYFHITVNGYTADPATRIMESHVPQAAAVLPGIRFLAERYSIKHVIWRYHPITFTQLTTTDWHILRFTELCQSLEGLTRTCVVGFHDSMVKVDRNMALLPPELHPFEPPREEQAALVQELAAIAANHGIWIQTCAEDFAVAGVVSRGACVNRELLDELWPHKAHPMSLYPSREECGCYTNRDIGGYETCPHGCAYCYAVVSRKIALGRYKAHDPVNDTRNAPYKEPTT